MQLSTSFLGVSPLWSSIFVAWLTIIGSANAQQCVPSVEDRERLRTLMLEAVDAAFKEQIMHLFEVWMKDDKDQPNRATTGARNATRAYFNARYSALKWNPPICKE